MVLVVGAIVVGIVLLIAAAAVLREGIRMGERLPEATFDFDQAVEWIVHHVSDDIAATLTLDDVELIIDLQLEHFRQTGVSSNGHGKPVTAGEPVVVGGTETVDYILEKAAEAGMHYEPEQVAAVVEAQLEYLRAVGALGPPVDPED